MTTAFQEQVYAMTKKIPKGKVSTYASIAAVLNSHPRAVGQALKCNPYAPEVPCHRVIASSGLIGGFNGETSGPSIERKINLLKNEGVDVIDGKITKNQIVLLGMQVKKF